MNRGVDGSSPRASRISLNQVGEVLLDHERGRPQTLLQIALGYRLRPVGDEDAQQVERLGRQGHTGVPAQQLASFRVEHERPEAYPHRALYLGGMIRRVADVT